MTNKATFLKCILTLVACLHFLVSESTSSLSANDFSIPEKSWGTEISDVDMMCEQFNREFKKKYNVSYLNYIITLQYIPLSTRLSTFLAF